MTCRENHHKSVEVNQHTSWTFPPCQRVRFGALVIHPALASGGGSIPLEAQRLGLEAHASDLNPAAVLITKGAHRDPPKFADRPPVNPASGLKGRPPQGPGAAPRALPTTCATTAAGCAMRQSGGSAICT